MKRVAVVVEGQTEQQFVEQVLAPRLLAQDVYPQAIITKTRESAAGAHRGGGDWSHYARILRQLVTQPQWSLVTTMMDFYAYPGNAPGRDCHPVGGHAPALCAGSREAAILAEIAPGSLTLKPFIMLHEFETLVIAAGGAQTAVLGDTAVPAAFTRMMNSAGSAELINDGQDTAPSKRVTSLIRDYRKPIDGVSIIAAGSFDAVLHACPRFADWYRLLSDV